MSRAGSVTLLTCALAGCSLFTDLSGASSGADPVDASASPEDGATDANAEGGATDADAGSSSDADAGDVVAGALASDGFDTGTTCLPWEGYAATATTVSDAYSGAQSCKVCLTANDANGGIRREFGVVAAGYYVVTARVKNVSSTDYRFTIDRQLDDGGIEASYFNANFGAQTGWVLATFGARTAGHLAVSVWFGNTFNAGDCALVDEIVVKKEP